MEDTLKDSTESIDETVTPPEPPKKQRKPLSQEALEKLKVARVKAAESNRSKKEAREKERKEREEEVKASYDPIVMVEQSDSDPEDLEAPPGVIIVRRKRRKPTPEYSQTQIEADRAYARMFGL